MNILLIPAHTHPLVNSTLGFTGHSFCVKSTIETITMDDVSPSFMCPIGREVMLDPVICADDHSYEQSNIEPKKTLRATDWSGPSEQNLCK